MRALVLGSAAALTACATADRDLPEPEPKPVQEIVAQRQSHGASLWNQDPESLFGNRRAREIGDILTVLVAINDQAEMLNDLQRVRTSERVVDAAGLFGLPQWAERALPGDQGLEPAFDILSDERVRGQGNKRRQDRITFRLAARIIDRLPNGDLVIEGDQLLQVGRDRRALTVEGIVRPEDITRQNTVPYDRIAEADIRLIGSGPLDKTARRGIGHRLIDFIAPF